MEIPLDPLVCGLVKRLDADLREDFAERAAIIEFDAGLERAHAECLALLGILHREPLALSGICVLQFELDGIPQWILTTDLVAAQTHVGVVGGMEVDVVDLADAVERSHGGMATLHRVE